VQLYKNSAVKVQLKCSYKLEGNTKIDRNYIKLDGNRSIKMVEKTGAVGCCSSLQKSRIFKKNFFLFFEIKQ
jgi:hypothetical protein